MDDFISSVHFPADRFTHRNRLPIVCSAPSVVNTKIKLTRKTKMQNKRSALLALSLSFITTLTISQIATAEDTQPAPDKHPVFDIWPATAPGESSKAQSKGKTTLSKGDKVTRVTDVESPTLLVYSPPADKSNGTSVLVCPGGGYNILAFDKEGTEIAEWLNRIGVTAFVLKYRVPRRKNQPKHLAPLQDAQRAIRLVRSKAEQLKIDPKRVGVLGFSAGGHLAAMLSTSFEQDSYKPTDDVDALSTRPDFTVLIYPAYMFQGTSLKKELRVTKKTPPALMIHADNDPHSALSSTTYYNALKQAGVPAAMHIFPDGGHGFGMRKSKHTASAWPRLATQWFRSQKLLEKSSE